MARPMASNNSAGDSADRCKDCQWYGNGCRFGRGPGRADSGLHATAGCSTETSTSCGGNGTTCY